MGWSSTYREAVLGEAEGRRVVVELAGAAVPVEGLTAAQGVVVDLADVVLPAVGLAAEVADAGQVGAHVVVADQSRPQLRAAIVLQNIRRDWSEDETLLVDWLAERDIDVIVALTKADKLKPMQRKKRVAELVRQIGRKGMSVVVTSAQSKLGVDGLWGEVRGRM